MNSYCYSYLTAEKFLNCVITSGNRGYQAFCQFMRNNPDNRYSRVMEALQIYPTANSTANGTGNNTNNANLGNNSAVRNVEIARMFIYTEYDFMKCGKVVRNFVYIPNYKNHRPVHISIRIYANCANCTSPALLDTFGVRF